MIFFRGLCENKGVGWEKQEECSIAEVLFAIELFDGFNIRKLLVMIDAREFLKTPAHQGPREHMSHEARPAPAAAPPRILIDPHALVRTSARVQSTRRRKSLGPPRPRSINRPASMRAFRRPADNNLRTAPRDLVRIWARSGRVSRANERSSSNCGSSSPLRGMPPGCDECAGLDTLGLTFWWKILGRGCGIGAGSVDAFVRWMDVEFSVDAREIDAWVVFDQYRIISYFQGLLIHLGGNWFIWCPGLLLKAWSNIRKLDRLGMKEGVVAVRYSLKK